ncbi:unnamed protein product [Lymnaea stagnalis]|uniref:glutathione gamma-glutamylcysteinyltransferase n=1 Tax=Lymnaea stagnalis TaxID=6523 RepID=A0AAV2HL65_LYMST
MIAFRQLVFKTSSGKKSKPYVIFKMAVSSTSQLENTAIKPQTLQFYRRPLPSTCIDFASEEGKIIFSEALAAGHMNSFFKLCSQYRTQDEPAYCGLTSLVMALNVLEIDPGRIWKGPWRWYHEEMLDCCTSLQVAREKGINMEQFICLARCNNLAASSMLGSDIHSIDELREEIKSATLRDDVVFVASYSRKTLSQTGDGHFSPIAGYHEGRDLALILDTARFKYPPHWVSVATLLEAMKTKDPETGRSRGYVILSSAKNQPSLLLFRPSCTFTIDKGKGKQCSELTNFAQDWTKGLSSLVGKLLSPKEIVDLALTHLSEMKSRHNLFITVFGLTLPYKKETDHQDNFVIRCPQPVKGDEKVTCIIKNLLNELESLETFKAAKAYFMNKTSEEKSKFLNFIQTDGQCSTLENETRTSSTDSCCTTSCSNNTACWSSLHRKAVDSEPSLKMTGLSADEKASCSSCEGTLTIGPEHAAALFLQVWPHTVASTQVSKCVGAKKGEEKDVVPSDQLSEDLRSPTLGQLLIEFISSDLSRSGGRYVTDEIGTIKVKIREVMRYHSQGIVSCCSNS